MKNIQKRAKYLEPILLEVLAVVILPRLTRAISGRLEKVKNKK